MATRKPTNPNAINARFGNRKLETIFKGLANHRRLQLLGLIDAHPGLTVLEAARATRVDVATASEHIRRMAIGGLVFKRNAGRRVELSLSPRGARLLAVAAALE